MFKQNDRVVHHAYGKGTVQKRKLTKGNTPIVFVKWDNPELGRFPEDKLPWEYESFWTNECDLMEACPSGLRNQS